MTQRDRTAYTALVAVILGQAGFTTAALASETWVLASLLAAGLSIVVAIAWTQVRSRALATAWAVLGATAVIAPYSLPLGWATRLGLAVGVIGLLSGAEMAHLVHRSDEVRSEGEATAHRALRSRLWRTLALTGVLLVGVVVLPMVPVPGLQPWIEASVEWAGAPGIVLAGATVALGVLTLARVRAWVDA